MFFLVEFFLVTKYSRVSTNSREIEGYKASNNSIRLTYSIKQFL